MRYHNKYANRWLDQLVVVDRINMIRTTSDSNSLASIANTFTIGLDEVVHIMTHYLYFFDVVHRTAYVTAGSTNSPSARAVCAGLLKPTSAAALRCLHRNILVIMTPCDVCTKTC